MSAQLSPETTTILTEFLSKKLSLKDLDIWLTQATFDEDLNEEEAHTLAALLNLTTEAGEGLADEREVHEAIAGLLSLTEQGHQAGRSTALH
jgi:hypothetical protein